MIYHKKLGIFAKVPASGDVKTRLVPPLLADEARDLYEAFLIDLFERLNRLKKVTTRVFLAGGEAQAIRPMVPGRFGIEPQVGGTLGERLAHAFEHLLQDDSAAVMIGSDSPDIPLQYIKRAFVKLKHKDVVLGPASDGGYYLIGLKRMHAALFDGVNWSEPTVLRETLERAQANNLSVGTVPLWYDVDTIESLSLLHSNLLARKLERRDRLQHVEHVIDRVHQRLDRC